MIINEKIVKDTPDYSFEKGVLTMSGKVFPDNAVIYWSPIVKEIEDYSKLKEPIICNFKFDYYNTASLLYLDMIFRILKKMSKNSKVQINWYYFYKDEDMQISGEDYKESSGIKEFNIIETK